MTETKSLPPDPDGMNEARAAWADGCLNTMAGASGCERGKEALGDMLCNCFHWCDRNGLDMDEMIERARSNYKAETTGDV